MESRAEEYRRRAERCLEMGPTFHNPQARDVLLQMAHVWLRLSDKCEYANAMVDIVLPHEAAYFSGLTLH